MALFAHRYLRRVFAVALLVSLGLHVGKAAAGDSTSVVRIHLPGYSTSSLPFLIAEELGFYRDEGLRIQITRIQTGSGIQALVAGAVDVSQIVGPTTLAAILGGAPLKVVMVFNDKPTYKLYVKKQFRRFADLKGARLGSSTPGSTNDRLLKVVLEKNGLDWRKDLSLIYIGLSEVMLKSLQSAAIDGAALTPPASFLAEDFGFYPLFSFINEVGALQGGVATSSAFLNGRREMAQRFIGATVRGLKYFKSNRSGTVKIMTKYMNLNADTAARVYDESVPSFVSDGTISEDFQDQVLDFELKIIGTDKRITRDRVFDLSLIKNIVNR
jgi:ABC-type nitrate/sulfonate/bicarbonate transport system substrate-binding protein